MVGCIENIPEVCVWRRLGGLGGGELLCVFPNHLFHSGSESHIVNLSEPNAPATSTVPQERRHINLILTLNQTLPTNHYLNTNLKVDVTVQNGRSPLCTNVIIPVLIRIHFISSNISITSRQSDSVRPTVLFQWPCRHSFCCEHYALLHSVPDQTVTQLWAAQIS